MAQDLFNSFMTGPDEKGRFGDFGGRFVSETLMPLILELEAQYEHAKTDDSFWAEMHDLWTHYVGRPSPLYFAERLTERLGGAKIYLKRDELNHTGAHKINNVLGQIILARRMGKTRIIAETGAGQHGVATATVCAKFGLKCVVYMGATDVERQAPNVFRMKLLGAEVVPVTSGRGTLKDAMNDALRDWVTNVRDTFYCIGTVAGPHPYPAMVRDLVFSSGGFEAKYGDKLSSVLDIRYRRPDSLRASIEGGALGASAHIEGSFKLRKNNQAYFDKYATRIQIKKENGELLVKPISWPKNYKLNPDWQPYEEFHRMLHNPMNPKIQFFALDNPRLSSKKEAVFA